MPIEGVILQMKSMHIDSVLNFPFPTIPDPLSLKKAETVLKYLGALTSETVDSAMQSSDYTITKLGRSMALFPLSPRFSRMLVSGQQGGCLPYVIVLVSALSVGDPFLREELIGNSGAENYDEEADIPAKDIRRQLRKDFFKMQHASISLLDS